jgi:uncharacterized protein (TIGR02246 family)
VPLRRLVSTLRRACTPIRHWPSPSHIEHELPPKRFARSRHFRLVNIRGEYRTGVQAFTKQHEFLFHGPFHGSTLHQDVVSVQFVRPDVAVVEVLTAVTGIQRLSPGTNTDEKGRLRTRLLQVLVKNGVEWKITDYHNTDVKADVPAPDPQ